MAGAGQGAAPEWMAPGWPGPVPAGWSAAEPAGAAAGGFAQDQSFGWLRGGAAADAPPPPPGGHQFGHRPTPGGLPLPLGPAAASLAPQTQLPTAVPAVRGPIGRHTLIQLVDPLIPLGQDADTQWIRPDIAEWIRQPSHLRAPTEAEVASMRITHPWIFQTPAAPAAILPATHPNPWIWDAASSSDAVVSDAVHPNPWIWGRQPQSLWPLLLPCNWLRRRSFGQATVYAGHAAISMIPAGQAIGPSLRRQPQRQPQRRLCRPR